MNYYFVLQYRRWIRWFKEIGLPPFLGGVLGVSVFFLFSKYLFFKTEFAEWIYLLLAITILLPLGDSGRTNPLKILYNAVTFKQLRLIENSIVTVPFLLYLLYENKLKSGLVLVSISLLVALIPSNWKPSRVLPTPFKRFPFEYIIGFRKAFLLILLSYFILYKSIEVGNANLGMGTLGMLALIAMSFFLQPEPSYYVWIYKQNSTQFLLKKMGTSFICASILIAPSTTALLIVFPEKVKIIFLIVSLGFLFLFAILVAKYSAYPYEINIPQALLFALSLWFPPMLLFIIPIFYRQAKRRLEPLLNSRPLTVNPLPTINPNDRNK